jgi:hypothetical protein
VDALTEGKRLAMVSRAVKRHPRERHDLRHLQRRYAHVVRCALALLVAILLALPLRASADDRTPFPAEPPTPPRAPSHPAPRRIPASMLSFGPWIPYTGEELGARFDGSPTAYVGWNPGIVRQIAHSPIALGIGGRVTYGQSTTRGGPMLRLAWISPTFGLIYVQGGPTWAQGKSGAGYDGQAGIDMGYLAIFGGVQRDDFTGTPTAYVGVRLALVEGLVALLFAVRNSNR